ncbi:(2Fe-2S)-binding protein [Actinomadura sp. 1N219]|uniref:(2Fe-2S)-binding protein n=1 Tax=Actinomadura sp. 1N219 TaxID=3375152 RepID=UPI00378EB1AC
MGRWTAEDDTVACALDVNDRAETVRVPPRRTLADALRDHGLTGTRLGCEHGVCGACTVLMDGRPARSCLALAVQAEGSRIETIEGGAPELPALRRAFDEGGALQCGFCTPGFLMLAAGLLRAEPDASPDRVREVISSNLCRCTGGVPILNAVLAAQRELAGSPR